MDNKLEIILAAKDQAAQVFKGLNNHVVSLSKSLFSFNAILGTVAGTAGLGLLVKNSVEFADAIGDAADRIGISTDALQEYRYAAQLSGVETESLDSNLEKFVKNLGEMRVGTGTLTSYLKKYDEQLLKNIQNAKSTDEALNLVFKALGNTKSEADRAALAAAAFGKAGIGMTLMAKDGAEELENMRQKAHELGIVMDEGLIRQSQDLDDKFKTLSSIIKTQMMSAVLQLAPGVETLVDLFTRMAPKISDVIENMNIFYGLTPNGKLKGELVDINDEMNKLDKQIKNMEEGWKKSGINPEDSPLYPAYMQGKFKRRMLGYQLQDISKTLNNQESAKKTRTGVGGSAWTAASVAEDTTESSKVSMIDYVLGVEQEMEKAYDAMKKDEEDLYNEMNKKAEARYNLEKDVVDRTKRLTLDEKEYRLWALDQEVEAMTKSADGHKETIDKIKEYQTAAMADIAKSTDKTFGEDMADAFEGWANGFSQTLNEVLWDSEATFGSIAESFGKMMTQIMIQKSIVEPIAGAAGSFFEGLFSGAGGVDGARASGGPVSAGKTYLVGEEGPELFSPGSSGTIIPNNRISGGGDTINVSLTVNAMDSRSVTQALSTHASQIVGIVQQAYSRRGKTGGPMA